MENAGFIGLSYQSALQRQLAVIANNVANANTTGFKAERIMLESVPYKGKTGESYTFVQDNGVIRTLSEGRMRHTGNALDVGLTGKGFLEVQTPAGPRWTRNGSLRVDEEGRIVTAAGLPVVDERDQPIRIDASAGMPEIARDGTISTPQGQVGKLKVVRFDREQDMRKINDNLLVTAEEPKISADARVEQGFLEDSNVEPVLEMTSMIDVSRSYQAVQKLVENEHDRERRAIERLAKAV